MKNIFYLFIILLTITIQRNAECRAKKSAGSAQILALKNDDTLRAWGGNFFSQPGYGTDTN